MKAINFKKRRKTTFQKTGHVIFIDFSQEAKEWIVGGPTNKRIYHYFNGSLVSIETYNPIKVKYYQQNKIPIIDKTDNQRIPSDAVNVPVYQQALGNLEIRRRLS